MAAGPAALDRIRWTELWTRLGAKSDGTAVFDRLLRAYAEPARAYHTATHINDCLDQFDRHRALVSNPDEVEAAIWFHDAVYLPGASDNEARSAELATSALKAAEVSPARIFRIGALILTTQHSEIPSDPDAQLLCDVDLSILGRLPPAFDAYEREIRQEYAWVPEAQYRQARSRILAGFLTRAAIYQTAAFADRYEPQARKNLTRALANLSG